MPRDIYGSTNQLRLAGRRLSHIGSRTRVTETREDNSNRHRFSKPTAW